MTNNNISYIEIQYKTDETVLAGVARFKVNLSFEEAIEYGISVFNNDMRHILIKDCENDKIIKVEEVYNKLVKSFVLNLFSFEKEF